MRKNYYHKMAFIGMLLIILFAFQNYTSREKNDFPKVRFITEHSIPMNLSNFDPNDLDTQQWQSLGFSEKQAATILNYKKIVGGKFISKEQFKKCYAVSAEKFAELESHILLAEKGEKSAIEKSEYTGRKEIFISKKFNPDSFSAAEWINMGFSEKQAEAIVKYRNYLGGTFASKEKFKECFIISSENYRKLEPYLLLPAKTPEHLKNSNQQNAGKVSIHYSDFNPNTMDIKGWQALGFSERQANTIINYRDKNLRGSFRTLDDIQKCFVISPEKFIELRPYIKISPELSKKQETDFSKIDLNAITFKQLQEFGFDQKSAAIIIGFRKKLGGFVNKQQILDTYDVDKDIVQKLIAVCPLNTVDVPRYSLRDAPEEWLKSHPYFKYSADKIIYYRISYPDDRKILKLLKLKPEYEERMKLYLK